VDGAADRGMPIARAGDMARRIVAFVTMVVVIAIAIAVMWRVYLHHASTGPHEEPTIVELRHWTPLNA
jgi:hypothetical protein